MYKGISNVPSSQHPAFHGRSRVKKVGGKNTMPVITFKKWDLDLSVALLIAVLAFTAAVGRVMASSLEPAVVSVPKESVIQTLSDSAQPGNEMYHFRTVPHMTAAPVYSSDAGKEHTFSLVVSNPTDATRFAFVVMPHETNSIDRADKPPAPSEILKQIKKEGFRWRAFPVNGTATYTWTAPAPAGDGSNFIDVVAFVGRERQIATGGALIKKVFVRDYAFVRYELQPVNDEQTTVTSSSDLMVSLSPSNPPAQTFQAGKKNGEVLVVDVTNVSTVPLAITDTHVTLEALNADSLKVTSEMLKKAFSTVTVTQGGELWGSQQFSVTGAPSTITATIPSGSRVFAPGEKKTVRVFLDLGSYETTDNAFSGLQFRSGIHFSLEQKDHEPAKTIFGDTFTVRGGVLSVEWKGDTPHGFGLGGAKQVIGKFQLLFKSVGSRTAFIKNISVDVSSTLPSTVERRLIIYKNSISDGNELGRYIWTPGKEINGTISLSSFAEQQVPNDSTKEYVITLDTGGARAENAVNVTIPANGITWTDFGSPLFTAVSGAPLSIKKLTY